MSSVVNVHCFFVIHCYKITFYLFYTVFIGPLNTQLLSTYTYLNPLVGNLYSYFLMRFSYAIAQSTLHIYLYTVFESWNAYVIIRLYFTSSQAGLMLVIASALLFLFCILLLPTSLFRSSRKFFLVNTNAIAI